jgi:hypothetical protein
MDRENIHLHLNKNVYLSNDRIWFKGYIIEKKNRPTQNTTNINVNLMNAKGQKIMTQLYFAENGLFNGYLDIPNTIQSGTYFIQAFTNYMNNFAEDESSIYRITLLNNDDKSFGWQRKINTEQLETQFYPEGGVFLEGVTNTMGMHIADCSGLGISLQDIEVIDTNGNLIANTATNQFGYGRFDISNATQQIYRIRFRVNGVQKEYKLPLPTAKGFTFSVNNYVYTDKAIVKIKTNAATAKDSPRSDLTMVIQQNDAASYVDVHFEPTKLEQTIVIPRNEISAGINSIYLVDSNLKLMAQRIIYDPVSNPPKSLLNVIAKSSDSVKITGASAIKFGTLSISVVPVGSINSKPEKSVQASLIFDSYLSEPIDHLNYYLEDLNRKKHYELDQLLLTKKSKYEWEKMMSAPPEKKYESDFGLAVKGVVSSDHNKGDIYKINMKSTALGFDQYSSLDVKNEFVFKNLLAIDSAKIYFLPKDKAGKILPHRLSLQITETNRHFKPLNVAPDCPFASYEYVLAFPKIENSILLDSINIVAKKSKLKYQNRMGNMTARSFKITESDANKSLLSFIASNGFTVSRTHGSIEISSNMATHNEIMRASIVTTRTETLRTTLNGPRMTVTTTSRSGNGLNSERISDGGPVVFIDDVMISNYDMLDNYSMASIDEIYLNKHSNDISRFGSSGMIKIYTKQITEQKVSPTGSPAIIIKNGFQKHTAFQNIKYDNVWDEGFQKLGTIFWNPIIETDENGTFSFAIPKMSQKAVRIVIEGADADGTMISESHVLEIP